MEYTDISLKLFPRRHGAFKRWLKAHGLEMETYGESWVSRTVFTENREGITVPRTKVYTRPNMDYVTLRNVATLLLSKLTRFGRVLQGYPMKMREADQKAKLLAPPEKPICPIHGHDRFVHWVSRNHWTCTANHFPQHFGMLRLS